MNELKKHALPLGLIAVLMFFKIVIIPIVDWQDEQLMKLGLLEKKANKIQQLLLNNNETVIRSSDLQQRLSELSLKFYNNQETEVFKLQQQKLIESELKKYHIAVKNIGWNKYSEVENTPLFEYQIEYNVIGKTENVINYLLSLSSSKRHIDIKSLRLSFLKSSKGKLGEVTARIKQNYYMVKNSLLVTQQDNKLDGAE